MLAQGGDILRSEAEVRIRDGGRRRRRGGGGGWMGMRAGARRCWRHVAGRLAPSGRVPVVVQSVCGGFGRCLCLAVCAADCGRYCRFCIVEIISLDTRDRRIHRREGSEIIEKNKLGSFFASRVFEVRVAQVSFGRELTPLLRLNERVAATVPRACPPSETWLELCEIWTGS